jgi:two-component system, chemotaxis family, chemotaxis protein CheY
MTGASTSPNRALVIDDVQTIRRVVSAILVKLGYEVIEAADGMDALERLEGMTVPDVALVDWNMPRLDGLEFVRAVRGQRAYDAMRLLMITTENELGRVSAALAAGADEYLMKPFTPEMLLEKLAILGVTPADPT